MITLKCFDAKEPSNSNSDRRGYGNNRYSVSNIDKWLNSAAASWYAAQHGADAPPTAANCWNNHNPYDTEAGFLANFEADFRNAILNSTIRVAKNTVTDGGGYEDITRKVFLLSNTEVGLSNENGVAEGTLWSYFSSAARRQCYPTAEAVSNSEYTSSGLNASSYWYWWLRTPSASGASLARYVGAGWAQNVDQDAFEKGIYAGLTAGYEEDATRDNACLLIYNATLCPKVANASENSVQRYVLDALMNPMSYLEIRFGLTRYTATLTGNECADLTGSSPLPAGTSKLAGHKAFQVSTDLSLLGRSVDIYVKDGKVFGVPCYAVDEIYYTFADASQLKEICQGGGFRLTDETEYYYNYARSSKEILNAVTANDKITVIDHDGDNAFDVVLVTTSRPATVTATSPLTVDVGGQSYEVQAFSQADTFAVGDAVYYSQVCGSGYIRRLNG